MSKSKYAIPAALALACAFGVGAAQARTDVQWSVNIGLPIYGQPVYGQPIYGQPIYAPVAVYEPAPVYAPVPVYQQVPIYVPVRPHYREPVAVYGYRNHRQATRWDVDGDGIPNRYDHVYNPRWDRNGNGVPDRREVRHEPRWDPRDVPHGDYRRDDGYRGGR